MEWLFLALAAAFSLATADALTKRYFGGLSAYEMGLTRLAYTVPWLILALLFIPWPKLDRTFFLSLAIAIPLEALAFMSYMKAIRTSPLSLTLPFLAFTPVFIILTGWIVLGETVTVPGVLGVILIVTGAYFLNLSRMKTGWREPFKAIFREPGSRLMLFVSFIYSITSTLGKLAVIHSNPYFFGISYYIVFTLFMFSFLPFVRGAKGRKALVKPLAGLIVGAVTAVEVFSHMLSISMVEAVYMISIKRTSIIFGVLYGAWLFRETRITERLTGAVIMIIGIFLIGWCC